MRQLLVNTLINKPLFSFRDFIVPVLHKERYARRMIPGASPRTECKIANQIPSAARSGSTRSPYRSALPIEPRYSGCRTWSLLHVRAAFFVS